MFEAFRRFLEEILRDAEAVSGINLFWAMFAGSFFERAVERFPGGAR